MLCLDELAENTEHAQTFKNLLLCPLGACLVLGELSKPLSMLKHSDIS